MLVSGTLAEGWELGPSGRLPQEARTEVGKRDPFVPSLRGVHPRLYLSPQRLVYLKKAISEQPRWQTLYTDLIKTADRAAKKDPPDYQSMIDRYEKEGTLARMGQLWQRPVGDAIPPLCLAWLLSGEKRYLEAAGNWAFTALDYPVWGYGSTADTDLAAGHMLAGLGLAYDWLYADLTEDERQRFREKLAPRVDRVARAGIEQTAPWNNSYMQNHQWVTLGGMATAAFALSDEVPEAASWVALAHNKFATTLETLGDDGASHEGYGYWEYGLEYIMRYTELAETCLNIDLYRNEQGEPNPWLANNAAYALYLSLPRGMWTRQQSILDFADCPRNHWHGPGYLLRNLARRFSSSPYRGCAQWLAAQFEDAGADTKYSGGQVLNFAWYDSEIEEETPSAAQLPLFHHFKDVDIASVRSSWEPDATLLAVKCGPPLGHRHCKSGINYGAGHVHPDAGHFILVAGGEVLFRDSGYTHSKQTANHSCLLVNGQGQKGSGKKWFDFDPWKRDPRAPRISEMNWTSQRTRIACDAAAAYAPELGVRKYERVFDFDNNRTLTIDDVVETVEPAELEWRLQVEGSLEEVEPKVWKTQQGEMTAVIRLEADGELETAAGELITNEHIRAEKKKYLAIRRVGTSSSSNLRMIISF